MISFTNVVDIDRPPREVFGYLSDLENTPNWNWAIESTRKVGGGEIGVGTRYRQIRAVPRRAVETLEITALEPDTRLEVTGDLASFQARLAYHLEPLGGATRVTNRVELDPPALLAPLNAVLAKRIKAAVADNLGMLRARLESAT
jgi:uncharacterized protein YndB with AHSA1/START domain